ncbi:MAG: hypothetical protein AABX04_03595 [Nanoarchaeota archaeon]
MEIEIITQILEGVRSALLLIGLFLSVKAVKALVQHESTERMHLIKKNVFVWLMWGMFFLVIATVGKNISLTVGATSLVGDGFLIVHYFFFLLAFSYFWKSSGKLHQLSQREKIFLVGVICLVLIGVVYLIYSLILPGETSGKGLEKVLHWLYPIIVSILFLSTYSVRSRVRAKLIDRSLWYISNGVFFYFLGYICFSYVYFSGSKLPYLPLIYTFLFIISAGYYVLGFLVARKKIGKD